MHFGFGLGAVSGPWLHAGTMALVSTGNDIILESKWRYTFGSLWVITVCFIILVFFVDITADTGIAVPPRCGARDIPPVSDLHCVSNLHCVNPLFNNEVNSHTGEGCDDMDFSTIVDDQVVLIAANDVEVKSVSDLHTHVPALKYLIQSPYAIQSPAINDDDGGLTAEQYERKLNLLTDTIPVFDTNLQLRLMSERRVSVMFHPSRGRSILYNILHEPGYILLAISIFFYNGGELIFGSWVYTLMVDLHYEQYANMETSMFWGGLLTGRLVNSFLGSIVGQDVKGSLYMALTSALLSVVFGSLLSV